MFVYDESGVSVQPGDGQRDLKKLMPGTWCIYCGHDKFNPLGFTNGAVMAEKGGPGTAYPYPVLECAKCTNQINTSLTGQMTQAAPDHPDRCNHCGFYNAGYQSSVEWTEDRVCANCGESQVGDEVDSDGLEDETGSWVGDLRSEITRPGGYAKLNSLTNDQSKPKENFTPAQTTLAIGRAALALFLLLAVVGLGYWVGQWIAQFIENAIPSASFPPLFVLGLSLVIPIMTTLLVVNVLYVRIWLLVGFTPGMGWSVLIRDIVQSIDEFSRVLFAVILILFVSYLILILIDNIPMPIPGLEYGLILLGIGFIFLYAGPWIWDLTTGRGIALWIQKIQSFTWKLIFTLIIGGLGIYVVVFILENLI